MLCAFVKGKKCDSHRNISLPPTPPPPPIPTPAYAHLSGISGTRSNPKRKETSNVSPVFKKEEKSRDSNYSPVSLTSVSCKGLQHIICSHLMRFFEDNTILYDTQPCVRKMRSCESQLVLTIQDLAIGLYSQSQTGVILLYFSKSFDKVPHQRFSLKLHYCGVRGHILEWVKSFLDGRTQQVILDGTASSAAPVTAGVPQGPVMGALLFFVYLVPLMFGILEQAGGGFSGCHTY